MLRIFSYAYWQFVYLFWRNVYSSPLPVRPILGTTTPTGQDAQETRQGGLRKTVTYPTRENQTRCWITRSSGIHRHCLSSNHPPCRCLPLGTVIPPLPSATPQRHHLTTMGRSACDKPPPHSPSWPQRLSRQADNPTSVYTHLWYF